MSELSLCRHIESGDPLLVGRPLGSALCCRRILTSSSRFLTSDFNTKSSGTQDASHFAAQPSQNSTDRSRTARLSTDSLINFCTKDFGTGRPVLKTLNAVQDNKTLGTYLMFEAPNESDRVLARKAKRVASLFPAIDLSLATRGYLKLQFWRENHKTFRAFIALYFFYYQSRKMF